MRRSLVHRRAGLVLALSLASVLAACGDRAPAASTAAAPPPPAPVADPSDDVAQAMQAFANARSFHASMRIQGGGQGVMLNEADYVAPDRYRIFMPNLGTQTIIGDTLYLTMRGHTTQRPLPAGTLAQWRDPARLRANAARMQVQALGPEMVGTAQARKYQVHLPAAADSTTGPLDVMLWVGEDGRPLRIEVDSTLQGSPVSTSIRYSHYDDPTIRIEPPR